MRGHEATRLQVGGAHLVPCSVSGAQIRRWRKRQCSPCWSAPLTGMSSWSAHFLFNSTHNPPTAGHPGRHADRGNVLLHLQRQAAGEDEVRSALSPKGCCLPCIATAEAAARSCCCCTRPPCAPPHCVLASCQPHLERLASAPMPAKPEPTHSPPHTARHALPSASVSLQQGAPPPSSLLCLRLHLAVGPVCGLHQLPHVHAAPCARHHAQGGRCAVCGLGVRWHGTACSWACSTARTPACPEGVAGWLSGWSQRHRLPNNKRVVVWLPAPSTLYVCMYAGSVGL